MRPITVRQQEVLDFIVTFRDDNGFPPTIREINAEFGFSSPNAAVQHLAAIAKKGWITREPGKARAIRLVAPAMSVPFRGEIS